MREISPSPLPALSEEEGEKKEREGENSHLNKIGGKKEAPRTRHPHLQGPCLNHYREGKKNSCRSTPEKKRQIRLEQISSPAPRKGGKKRESSIPGAEKSSQIAPIAISLSVAAPKKGRRHPPKIALQLNPLSTEKGESHIFPSLGKPTKEEKKKKNLRKRERPTEKGHALVLWRKKGKEEEEANLPHPQKKRIASCSNPLFTEGDYNP